VFGVLYFNIKEQNPIEVTNSNIFK